MFLMWNQYFRSGQKSQIRESTVFGRPSLSSVQRVLQAGAPTQGALQTTQQSARIEKFASALNFAEEAAPADTVAPGAG